MLRRAWPALVDGAVDGLVVALAAWTLVYEIALLLQVSIRWAALPWLVVAVVLALTGARRNVHRALPTTTPGPGGSPRWLVAAGAVLVVVTAAAHRSIGLIPLAVVAILLLVPQLLPWLRRPADDRPAESAESAESVPGVARTWEHVLAATVSAGLAVLSLFLLKPDQDDVYYVNRATWIAHHGIPVIKDTMFGPGTLTTTYGGGLPTPSVEALQGSLAALLHLQAASMVYLVWTPLASALFGWVTWRLVRAWAPAWPGLVYAVAVLFVLASGKAIVGTYSIDRIWQGKVTAFAVLVPLVWLYLGRLANGRDRRTSWLLVAAGVSFVGLTTTSALLAPVIFAAGLLAAVVLRSRPLLIGAVGFVAAPLVNGIVQKFGPAVIGPQDSVAAPPDQVYLVAFGSVGALAVLAVLATVLAPRLVAGRAGVVAACAALAVMVVYLPGVLGIVNVATNAGPVIWRLAIEAPTCVFVGLLVVTPLPPLARAVGERARALAAPALAVVLALVIALSGAWLWSSEAGATLTARPTWKVGQHALDDVRAVQRLHVGSGLWLLPPTEMEIVAISDGDTYPVVPRPLYLTNLDPTTTAARDRAVLLGLVSGKAESPARVATALSRLRVALACVHGGDAGARKVLSTAVGSPLRKVGHLRCHLSGTGS